MLFFIIVLSVAYLSLAAGIEISKLDAGPLEIRKLYIKWDNKITLRCGFLGITPSDDGQNPKLGRIHDAIMRFSKLLYGGWFERIDVERLHAGTLDAAIRFAPQSVGTVDVRAENVHSVLTLRPVEASPDIFIEAHTDLDDFNASIATQGILQPESSRLYLTSDLNLSDRIFLTMPMHAGEDGVRMNLFSNRPFDDVAAAVKPLHLNPDVEQWIVARAEARSHVLHTLHTVIPYDEPSRAFESLYAELTAYGVRYNFTRDPESFEPVAAERVDVLFRHKVLEIKPFGSLFYGIRGGSTWLDIDFRNPDAVLNLYLHLKAALSPPIHRLIASYGIRLPFVQTQGSAEAQMQLHINLRTNAVGDSGEFLLRDARIDFSGIPVELTRADVRIRGSSVTIADGNASLFDGRVQTRIDGTFDPAASTGGLRFGVQKAGYDFNTSSIDLSAPTLPLQLEYLLFPDGDRIRLEESHWRFGGHTLELAAFDAPFSFKKFTLQLPSTLLRFDRETKAYLAGELDLKSPLISLTADLLGLKVGHLRSNQPFIPVNLTYDGNLTISGHSITKLKADDTDIIVRPFTATVGSQTVSINPTPVSIENLLKGTIAGHYDLVTGATELNVSNFSFDNQELGELFRKENRFKVYVIPDENGTEVIVPSLNMLFSFAGSGWRLHFFSLEGLAADSQLMHDYNITDGTFTAYSENGDFPVTFAGVIRYPYALTLQHDKPVTAYHYVGTIGPTHDINITLNDAVNVQVGDSVYIHANHVGFSQPEMTRFYQEHRFERGSDSESKNGSSIRFDANDTFIRFGEKRTAPADTLQMQYSGNLITLQLYHGPGGITFEAEGDTFFLYGKDLDDRFMDSFFQLSDFNGGRLSFYVRGDNDAFSGLVRIDDTTIYDYVLLNNLFAFFNTVPALITFSAPGYSTKGIKINSAYAKLDFANGMLDVSGIKVDSDELDFAGTGRLDYTDDTMDMNLSVKTQAGENIRKIPLVGYILVGDDRSVLTTVKVTGPMSDPRIDTTLADDIIVAPFNILKRTINFPLHYLEKMEKSERPNNSKRKSAHTITSGVSSEY